MSLTIFVLLLLLFAGYLFMEEYDNFHPITPGEAYRSAQLDSGELTYYIRKYNIKSIINLRGDAVMAPWYREEKHVSAEYNVKLYDISLSACREPAEGEIRTLIMLFNKAPRPVLIHCRSGADRSGLVAAMWKVIVDKEPKSEAEKQLSLFFGHIPIGKTAELDRFFKNWNPSVN
jgi:protein tyrosine/serine phosphatase